jgi:hypothetical protein
VAAEEHIACISLSGRWSTQSGIQLADETAKQRPANDLGRHGVASLSSLRVKGSLTLTNHLAGNSSGLSYEGVYVLMEKIKRGPDRVNIRKSRPEARDSAKADILFGHCLQMVRNRRA